MEKKKNGQNAEKREILTKRIEEEHALFYKEMVSRPSREAYHSCGKIWFYESVYEYFLYNDRLSKEQVSTCLEANGIMESMWNLYLKDDSLNVDTWEEIGRIIEAMGRTHSRREKSVQKYDDNYMYAAV